MTILQSILRANMDVMTQEEDGDPRHKRERRVRSTRIGRQLRQMYDEVVQEEIPDEFLELLERADQKRTPQEDS